MNLMGNYLVWPKCRCTRGGIIREKPETRSRGALSARRRGAGLGVPGEGARGLECQEEGRVPCLLGSVISGQVCERIEWCADGTSSSREVGIRIAQGRGRPGKRPLLSLGLEVMRP